jgi:hypothetical protein
MATPRETLKYYFRKHALPTEQQFAELIDAFVHVDEDTITQEKIDGLINALADKVSSETFESFKTEIQETVTNNGGDLSALTARVTSAEGNITTLRDDVDTNADNISGLNQRVDALEERPQITVDSTLDGESTNPVENKAVTEALGSKADSADVTALSERVSTLENAEPPQVTGSYLKQIADLDSYEGTEGEIVQYIGATNENYRRGFCYERKAITEGNSSAGELVEGETVTFKDLYRKYPINGRNYVSKSSLHDSKYRSVFYAPYNDYKEAALCINVDCLTTKPDESLCFKNWTSGDTYEVYLPLIAFSSKGETVDFEVKDNDLYVNGKECTQSGSVNTGTIYDEETKQAFVLSALSKTDGGWAVVLPATVGNVYESAAFMEDNMQVIASPTSEQAQGSVTWMKDGEEVNLTPLLLEFGAATEETQISWQVIATSPCVN